MEINWEQLRLKALEASKNSYAPYSNYPVGAAAIVDDGRVVTGANVENSPPVVENWLPLAVLIQQGL
jgi:cytidine deaminase